MIRKPNFLRRTNGTLFGVSAGMLSIVYAKLAARESPEAIGYWFLGFLLSNLSQLVMLPVGLRADIIMLFVALGMLALTAVACAVALSVVGLRLLGSRFYSGFRIFR